MTKEVLYRRIVIAISFPCSALCFSQQVFDDTVYVGNVNLDPNAVVTLCRLKDGGIPVPT